MADLAHVDGADPTLTHSRGQLTVCLIEDQVPLRDWLVTLLSDQGIEVTAAVSTLAEGEAAIHRFTPDVAIIDNHLPDGRGIDLCATLAVEHPAMTTILHTGLVSAEEEREAISVGVAAVVLKSIRSRELVDLLATLRPDGPEVPPE
ncbi:hypothetical protein BH09ACT12_BH09ACT12_00620 [soil metagenome]